MTLRLIVALSLGLVPFAASAAPAAEKAEARPSAPASAPTRVYEFDGDDVDGESLRPEGIDTFVRLPGGHENMIKVRTHFIPHLLKIAVDI
jgi:hypothetical protein